MCASPRETDVETTTVVIGEENGVCTDAAAARSVRSGLAKAHPCG